MILSSIGKDLFLDTVREVLNCDSSLTKESIRVKLQRMDRDIKVMLQESVFFEETTGKDKTVLDLYLELKRKVII